MTGAFRPVRWRGGRLANRYAVWLLLALLAASSSASAQSLPATDSVRMSGPSRDSVLEAQVRQLSSELRCPVCQGLSLQDSPSELSQEMRDVIRDQLRAGRTPEQVTAYFVGKYGEWVLLEPEPQGFNLLIYVLPMLAVLAGAALLVVAMRRWTTPAGDAADEDTSAADADGAEATANDGGGGESPGPGARG
ncbi:MAG TPA: cytochrome c-type biogenesis protein CcmH [Gemmatimonadaceae bacterium]|nr:cytochrome c-type biogenesis protein CcmH [Gemmatimonadaceae bacterium]